jgi:acetyl-CoA acetyltransferase
MSGPYRLALAVGVEKIFVPRNPAISDSAIATSGEQTTATKVGLTWVADLTTSSRRLMSRYGWTARDFATVASMNRRHAALNPEAELRQEISVDDVLRSRMVADKETALRIASGRHPMVAGMGLVGARYVSNRAVDDPPGMLSMDEARRSFALAYERAGLGPEDVQLGQVHDSIAPEEMWSYQVIGLCAPGDEAAFLNSGATSLGGRVPVNTDGGLIARGHPIAASGVAQVVETTRPLRAAAGGRQVLIDGRQPRVAAIPNAGAQGGPAQGVAVSAAFLMTA